MKIKILKYLAAPIFFTLVSCEGNSVFREFDRFDSNRWFKNQVQTYEVTIEKSGSYDLQVDFSHVYGANLPEIPIQISIERANEKTIIETAQIRLKDAAGNAISDCTGDICDLEQIVLLGYPLVAGQYTFRLSQHFNYDYLPNVIGVGIAIHPTSPN